MEKTIQQLNYLLDRLPILLSQISEEKMSEKPAPNKWSKKEIMGHLIDSATNNHQRFVRGQFEDVPSIRYDQNKWNEFNFYQQIESEKIISFWTAYNRQLIEIIQRIPVENLKKEIRVGDNTYTLEFLINDYVDHMEHHLRQVIDY